MSSTTRTICGATRASSSTSGPTHPAMHGALRMVRQAERRDDREVLLRVRLHPSRQGKARRKPHLSQLHGLHGPPELLLGDPSTTRSTRWRSRSSWASKCPSAAIWIRMMCCELARVIDHLVCVGINAVDLGAFSFFLYGFHQREEGLHADRKALRRAPDHLLHPHRRPDGGCARRLGARAQGLGQARPAQTIDEMDRLLTNNKIWKQRTVGVASSTKSSACSTASRAPTPARPESTSIFAATSPACSIRTSSLMSRSRKTATFSIATWFAWPRSASRSTSLLSARTA